MNRQCTAAVLFAALFMAGASASPRETSPTANVTGNVFKTDADRFMSVTDWSDAGFEKGFLFLKDDRNICLDAGGAFKVGPVYLGAAYYGDLFQQMWNATKNVSSTETVTDGTVGSTVKTTESGESGTGAFND